MNSWRKSLGTLLVCVALFSHHLFAQERQAEPLTRPLELAVMSFNIEWGGTHVSFEQVIEVIRRSGADVVGIQEAEGNLQRLAEALGWNYNARQYVISPFPLAEPPGADGLYLFLEVSRGTMVVVSNLHLPSDPYGPDAVRDGASPTNLAELERNARLPYVQDYLTSLKPFIHTSTPVFLTGDFNAPSHADWTAETVGIRPYMPFAFDWPVSRAVSDAGLRDSWRVVYPDPLSHPGLTWWAGRPPLDNYNPGGNDPQDRIDFVWFAGNADVKSSEILGEQGAADVSIGFEPWPSDHRAVLSRFEVQPASMPRFATSSKRIYQQGEDVRIEHHGPALPSEPDTLLVSRLGKGQASTAIVRVVLSGNERASFPAARFEPGHYLLSMGSSDGALAPQNEFWVLADGAKPVIEVSASLFEAGQPIGLTWKNAPGNRNDYIAIYKAGNPDNEAILVWRYTGSLPAGSLTLGAGKTEGIWPLASGDYVARLLKDDGYEQLAESSAFKVE